MNLLWLDLRFRRRVRAEVKRLGPWYHQIQILPFLWTRPWTQATIGELIHAERGGPKFRRFILPLIKPYLKGAVVIELGTNAAHNLVLALRAGAAEVWGIEPDHRYRSQAMLVRQCLGLQQRMTIIDHIPQGDLSYGRRANLGLMCAVLRHVDPLERVNVLHRMGRLCSRVLIQGNGLPDAPDGDNIQSILRDTERADLTVDELRSEPHVRGLRILVRAK